MLQLITEGFAGDWPRGLLDPGVWLFSLRLFSLGVMMLPMAAPCGYLAMGPTARGIVDSCRSSPFDCFKAHLAWLD